MHGFNGTASIGHRFSTFLFLHPRLLLLLLLMPPLLWLGIIYLGSLLSLLLQSFYRLDDFTGLVVREFSLNSYAELFTRPNLEIVLRTTLMAAAVTIASAILALPLGYYMARVAPPRTRMVMYLLVLLPLWSSYIVRVFSWKLILAKEGILNWLVEQVHLEWLLDAILSIPVIGGSSLSFSYLGAFIVFVYIWLPYMILPVTAAFERIPQSVIEASADLGARPLTTFRKTTLPLALPGVVAGSIFTFSLTLGDYIIPGAIGNSSFFIGQAVLSHQGTAGNIPLAAAFTVVPIAIMGVYLWIARRMGAFDAL
jgi:putative spermidine/putrescine transport system permease protein